MACIVSINCGVGVSGVNLLSQKEMLIQQTTKGGGSIGVKILTEEQTKIFLHPLVPGEEVGDLEDVDNFGVDGWLYLLSCLDIWVL